jgi:hypothetical protein
MGLRTEAIVTDLLPVRSSNNSTGYKPVFEYTVANGQKHRIIAETASNPSPYRVGEKVTVIYLEESPEKIKTIGYWGLYRWTLVPFMLAGPALIIGFGYLMFMGQDF